MSQYWGVTTLVNWPGGINRATPQITQQLETNPYPLGIGRKRMIGRLDHLNSSADFLGNQMECLIIF